MACIQITSSAAALLACAPKRVNAAIHLPKLPRLDFSIPNIPSATKLHQVEELKFTDTTAPLLEKNNHTIAQHHYHSTISSSNKAIVDQLYAILEAIADRIEMHHNMSEQRNNWNTLLLNSINMITLTATTMAGVAATTGAGAPLLALKLSSALLFSAATGMLLIMNKIQPSQLTEEQRNATRLFKNLHNQIQTTLAIGNCLTSKSCGLQFASLGQQRLQLHAASSNLQLECKCAFNSRGLHCL